MNRREFIAASAAAGTGTLFAAEKTTDGGYAEVSWAERRDDLTRPVPAGAHSLERFRTHCVGCNRCTAECPSRCLRPSAKLSRFGLVELDFRYGWCRPECDRCAEVCPTGAIVPLSPREKTNTHVGHAVWSRERCVRTTAGDSCHACEKHCPVKAIKLIDGFPVVDRDRCIGCGACEHYCPARPVAAIRVKGFERHREVRPMGEADLVAEMYRLLSEGFSLVVARNGVIVHTAKGSMLEPLKAALAREDSLRGAIVADRVVGKSAAKLHIQGGVRKVVTPVLAAKAKEMLTAAGIEVEAKEIVPMILNRDRTGECPMDAALQ